MHSTQRDVRLDFESHPRIIASATRSSAGPRRGHQNTEYWATARGPEKSAATVRCPVASDTLGLSFGIANAQGRNVYFPRGRGVTPAWWLACTLRIRLVVNVCRAKQLTTSALDLGYCREPSHRHRQAGRSSRIWKRRMVEVTEVGAHPEDRAQPDPSRTGDQTGEVRSNRRSERLSYSDPASGARRKEFGFHRAGRARDDCPSRAKSGHTQEHDATAGDGQSAERRPFADRVGDEADRVGDDGVHAERHHCHGHHPPEVGRVSPLHQADVVQHLKAAGGRADYRADCKGGPKAGCHGERTK